MTDTLPPPTVHPAKEQRMKLMNEYAREVPHYDDIPKSVLAALAFSLALRLEVDDFDGAKALLITEWITLHEGGIIPQPVPSKFHDFIAPWHADDDGREAIQPGDYRYFQHGGAT